MGARKTARELHETREYLLGGDWGYEVGVRDRSTTTWTLRGRWTMFSTVFSGAGGGGGDVFDCL